MPLSGFQWVASNLWCCLDYRCLTPILWLHMAFFLCLYVVLLLCMSVTVSNFPIYKDTESPVGLESTLMTFFELDYFCKRSYFQISSRSEALEIRTSASLFWKVHNSAHNTLFVVVLVGCLGGWLVGWFFGFVFLKISPNLRPLILPCSPTQLTPFCL